MNSNKGPAYHPQTMLESLTIAAQIAQDQNARILLFTSNKPPEQVLRDEYNGLLFNLSPWLTITIYPKGSRFSNLRHQFTPELPLFQSR